MKKELPKGLVKAMAKSFPKGATINPTKPKAAKPAVKKVKK